MAKLVVIGDSLGQGFQNGAISRTDYSFPALIARSMGLDVPQTFRVPNIPGDGLPLNIERLLRKMARKLGSDIDTSEWLFEVPFLVSEYCDQIEDFYERGSGSRPAAFGGSYHNLSVWGFRVLDSFKVNSSYCQKAIEDAEGWLDDDFLGLPSAPMYRTARRVLNPKWREERKDWTQIENLKHISENEEGVENLVIFLGSNDCLRTVVFLEINDMETNSVSNDPIERRQWNLTHPGVFQQDFETLANKVSEVIQDKTKVFVGTIPHVTIPPVSQGIPPINDGYFKFYTRFFINARSFNSRLHKHLTGDQAQFIDERIDQFNAIICDVVNNKNWNLVETGKILDELAVKRNGFEGMPELPLRNYYESRGYPNHPLLDLNPVPSILRLTTQERGQRVAGGLIGLDCVHPSIIGYGIVAEEFLRAMQKAGVTNANPEQMNWEEIIAQDTLIQQPPVLWDDIVEAMEKYPTFWETMFRVMT